MRSYLPDYELAAPASLSEALALLARQPGSWKPLAGGTDLMVLLEAGKLSHKRFISIWHLRELKGIAVAPEAVVLGALTTYTEVLSHPLLRKEFPLLCQAARETGGVATQNRGTLGGNIANASPAADSSPALMVYDAELELISSRGSRRVPYHRFHSGYKQMDLRPDELIHSIHLPRPQRRRAQYYRKVGTRQAQAISKVVFAGVADVEGGVLRDIRLALGSVAPTVLRCLRTESVLRGKEINPIIELAQAALTEEIAPIDDIRSTLNYRRQVSLRLLEDFLRSFS